MATTTRTPSHDFSLADVPPRREPLLAATGLTKRFGQLEALTNVDFGDTPREDVVAAITGATHHDAAGPAAL